VSTETTQQDVSPTDDHSVLPSDHDESRRLKKTVSLRERTVERSRPPVSRATKSSSTLASRPASINSQGSGAVAKPRAKRPEPAYPLYDYADNVPRPKVIYIRDEDQANEMIAGLNG
jgi:hypothetical protein